MSDTKFIPPDRLDAGEFVIRRYDSGDGRALCEATNESYDHLRVWMPWARNDQTVAEAEALCRQFAAKFLMSEDFVLGIWEGDKLVGGTGFHMRHGPIEWRNAEIGMWIRAGHAGQGLGTRVLTALLRWGFEDWGWERIVWRCDPANVASARVALKCGLKLDGTMRSDMIGTDGTRRDTQVYSMLKSEYGG